MSELGQFALGIAFGLAALGFFFGPIGKALGARISGGKLRDPEAGLTTGEMSGWRRWKSGSSSWNRSGDTWKNGWSSPSEC
jgi:hypothetical protein